MSDTTDPGTCLKFLDRSERTGLILIGVSSLLSASAVLTLIFVGARNYIRAKKRRRRFGTPLSPNPVDGYFISLLVSDLFLSIGGLMSFRWASLRQSHCGSYCDAQGAVTQLGEQSVAISTLWIAIITFAVIFFEWNPNDIGLRLLVIIALCISWTFMFLDVIVGWAVHHDTTNHGGIYRYYTPTPYWCFISPDYTTERIVLGYLWIWICAFLCIILYTLLFFKLRGNIVVVTGNFPRFRLIFRKCCTANLQWNAEQPMDVDDNMKKAKKMLAYPISYVLIVTPLSVVRWLYFRGHQPPASAMLAVAFIFKLSGLVNACVFMATRPGLLVFGRENVDHVERQVEQHHQGSEDIPLEEIGVGRPSNTTRTKYGIAEFEHSSRVDVSEVPHPVLPSPPIVVPIPTQTPTALHVTLGTRLYGIPSEAPETARPTNKPSRRLSASAPAILVKEYRPTLALEHRYAALPVVYPASTSRHLTSQWFDDSDIASPSQSNDGRFEDDLSPIGSRGKYKQAYLQMSPIIPGRTGSGQDGAKSVSPVPSTFLDL